MSKKLKSIPEPPDPCSDREAAQFRRIARQMKEEDILTAESVPFIADLATTTVWKKNIEGRRQRLLELLKLEAAPNPDLKLKYPAEFAARVDSYLPAADTCIKAYELAEKDHIAVFNAHKYASYDSYRTARREREQKI